MNKNKIILCTLGAASAWILGSGIEYFVRGLGSNPSSLKAQMQDQINIGGVHIVPSDREFVEKEKRDKESWPYWSLEAGLPNLAQEYDLMLYPGNNWFFGKTTQIHVCFKKQGKTIRIRDEDADGLQFYFTAPFHRFQPYDFDVFVDDSGEIRPWEVKPKTCKTLEDEFYQAVELGLQVVRKYRSQKELRQKKEKQEAEEKEKQKAKEAEEKRQQLVS